MEMANEPVKCYKTHEQRTLYECVCEMVCTDTNTWIMCLFGSTSTWWIMYMCTGNAPSYFSTGSNLNRATIIISWHAPYWVDSSLRTVRDELVYSSLSFAVCVCACFFARLVSLIVNTLHGEYMRFRVSPKYSNEAPIYHSAKASIYSFYFLHNA